MNLKEAFRYKSKINELIHQAFRHINSASIYETEEEHKKSSAIKTEADEIVPVFSPRIDNMDVNQILNFVNILLNEYTGISEAIDATMTSNEDGLKHYKATLDTARMFREVCDGLRVLTDKKNMETKTSGTGTIVSSDGIASTYNYTVVRRDKLTYDSKKLSVDLRNLLDTADNMSDGIERLLITTEVAFEPKFGVNDSFYMAAMSAGLAE